MTIDPQTPGGIVPDRAQVVIVGGGVTGCSIAYHLAHLGWTDVVLLEQHQLTAGTTWHAAGLITSAGMTDETALFFSRYSRDLYTRLEQETGHSTGFRPVGHISLATSARRQEALRREAAWMHGFGVDDVEISPRELADLWPLARTDDVLSAFYVADEGRADPVGVATSLAKGARQLGVRVAEGVTATGVETRGRQVPRRAHRRGPDRDRGRGERGGHVGPPVRRPGRRRRPAPGRGALLPAYRHGAGDGPGPAGHRGPGQLRLLPPRGRRDAGGSLRAGRRAVVAGRRARRVLVRENKSRLGADGALPRPGAGPDPGAVGNRRADLLLRAGVVHRRCAAAARARARAGRLLRRGGPELAGHPVRRRGRQHARPLDRGRGAAGGRDERRHRPDAQLRDVAPVPRRADRGAAGGAVRGRGLAFVEAVDRAERAPVGAARPAGRGGRALRGVGGLGVRRVVRARGGGAAGPLDLPAYRAGPGPTRSSGASMPPCGTRWGCWT